MAITNKSESRNFNATSEIDNVSVMYMNASYNTQSKELSFNQSIRDTDVYKKNKAEVDNDYETWKTEVYTEIFGE